LIGQRREKDAAEEGTEEAVDEGLGQTPLLIEQRLSRCVWAREDGLEAGELKTDDGEDEAELVSH
jgi:hypothetical protein